MIEASVEHPFRSIATSPGKEAAISLVRLFHITDRKNIDSIKSTGLLPAKNNHEFLLRNKADNIINLWCRILKTPANRKSIYALTEDPRVVNQDNLTFKPEFHSIIELSADPRGVFVAHAGYFDDVSENISLGNIPRAHLSAIRYCRSMVSLQRYKDTVSKNPASEYPKTEVLIPKTVSPEDLNILT